MTATRRQFIAGGCAALAGMTVKGERRIDGSFAGSFVNDAFVRGHQIRDHAPISSAPRQERIPLVIVGGGIAGLSAAWRLQKRGFRDFVLLEMNDQAGGNARSGENEVSAYPWAAHYVPVPGPKAVYVRELFEELGVLRDGVWNETVALLQPAGTAVPVREMAGRHRAGHRAHPPGSRAVSTSGGSCSPRFARAAASRSPWNWASSTGPRDLDRLSFADWLRAAGRRFAAGAVVHELLLPRRLWRDGGRYVGVGRRALLRVARTGGERSAYLAGGQRMDHRAVVAARGIVCAHGPDGAANRAAGKPICWC